MPPIIQELKAYFKTRFDLIKYETADQAIAIIADLVTDIVIALFLLMAFILLTVSLAFFAATIFKSYWAGFGLVTLLYLLVLFFGHLLKIPLQNRLIRMLITKAFKKR